MSWNRLTYALPLYGLFKTMASFLPQTYAPYDRAPVSPEAGRVQLIALRILSEEQKDGAIYSERVRDLIEGLPDRIQQKDVEALVATRLKVVSFQSEALPIQTTGTDLDHQGLTGSFYFVLPEKVEPKVLDALPWIATHEMNHILEQDWNYLPFSKACASFIATFFSVEVMNWPLVPSIGCAMLANAATHAIASRHFEQRADAFANSRCSAEERTKAIALLQNIESQRSGMVQRFLASLTHPSEASRIDRIKRSLRELPV